jgi:hypothetical protein
VDCPPIDSFASGETAALALEAFHNVLGDSINFDFLESKGDAEFSLSPVIFVARAGEDSYSKSCLWSQDRPVTRPPLPALEATNSDFVLDSTDNSDTEAPDFATTTTDFCGPRPLSPIVVAAAAPHPGVLSPVVGDWTTTKDLIPRRRSMTLQEVEAMLSRSNCDDDDDDDDDNNNHHDRQSPPTVVPSRDSLDELPCSIARRVPNIDPIVFDSNDDNAMDLDVSPAASPTPPPLDLSLAPRDSRGEVSLPSSNSFAFAAAVDAATSHRPSCVAKDISSTSPAGKKSSASGKTNKTSRTKTSSSKKRTPKQPKNPKGGKNNANSPGKRQQQRRKRPDNSPDAVLDEKLKSLFSEEQMRGDTDQWNMLVAAQNLSDAELARLTLLRRRAKSCMYASKSRSKQTAQLEEALATCDALQADNNRLLGDVESARANANAIRDSLSSVFRFVVASGVSVPGLDSVLASVQQQHGLF